ncbi:hypothetical protein DV515_00011513 [Chloebia gouldiae]|uniref:Uncharacterized protein n=1 Tax=Chloebia gouldiae TaxID=44316 RepID=A0A3L8S5W0_CHLGU|nr:hypothetical protein DV515_00011513 [Chloebia gouldiae]
MLPGLKCCRGDKKQLWPVGCEVQQLEEEWGRRRAAAITFQHLAGSLGISEEGFPGRRQVRNAEPRPCHGAATDSAGRGGRGGGCHCTPARPGRTKSRAQEHKHRSPAAS